MAAKQETYTEWLTRLEAAEQLVLLAAHRAVATGTATPLLVTSLEVLEKVEAEKPTEI
jgi:hypothetical protein